MPIVREQTLRPYRLYYFSMRATRYFTPLICGLILGCAAQSGQEDAVASQALVWRVHCETSKSFALDLKAVPGVYHGAWQWAEAEAGEVIYLRGQLEGGFFLLAGVATASGETLPASKAALRQSCLDTIARDEPRDLGRVMAARDSRDLDVPIVYPEQNTPAHPITRLVIFGDSLSDAGRIKHRLQVFPGNPYWLGRFSNGPVWPDYLALASELAVLNRAYGGASINPPHDLDDIGLIGFVKDEGRFFVSGSLSDQTEKYLQDQSIPGRIDRADNTAYLIWAGANDYISKEPISGLITTFLNKPRSEQGYQSVADDTINGISAQVRTLYGAGARHFILVNLPDLGRSPIVLQNDSYHSGLGLKSDTGRRVELSERLSILTDYHNQVLAQQVGELRQELADAQILLVDSHALTASIFAGTDYTGTTAEFDYGFDLDLSYADLAYRDTRLRLQQACYAGMYLGSLDKDDTCEHATTALFWDVIHPATLAHCWQAHQVGDALAESGWIAPWQELTDRRLWCQRRIGELSNNQ